MENNNNKDLKDAYGKKFWSLVGGDSYVSSKNIIPILFEYYEPKSVIDIGCGIGIWLRAFTENGVDNIKFDRIHF